MMILAHFVFHSETSTFISENEILEMQVNLHLQEQKAQAACGVCIRGINVSKVILRFL